MIPQSGVNVVCTLKPGSLSAVQAVLQEMAVCPAENAIIPFGRLEGVHFGRVLALDEAQDVQGKPIPAQLLLMADLDGPPDAFMRRLVEVSGTTLDQLFGHCTGYPDSGQTSNGSRLDFLRSHQVRSSAYYANTAGRTVVQICQEARLHDAIECFLDTDVERTSVEPSRVRAAIQEFVKADPDQAWATIPARQRDAGWWAREMLWLVGLLALVPVALLLLPAVVVYIVVLRIHEIRDLPSTQQPTPGHVAELSALEDKGPQNQFSAVGLLKPGPFRRVTAWAVLRITDVATHHLFFHANLAGVKTIHFARWVPLDGGRRMIFASNYDGSLESYMDDFIDKVSFGLNATFSNGLGYPRTNFLLFGGAKDELAFKAFLRVHQVPTQVWYSAYPALTAINIENNARIRAGLSGQMDPAQTQGWLALL